MNGSAARRLRDRLTDRRIVLALAPHDVFSARIAAAAGAELLFLGGFGMAASTLGLPDLGLATINEMADAARRMADRVEVPVIVDGDTGHGGQLNVVRTVREFERAGAAGMLLEDQVFPKRCGHFAGKQVVPKQEMVDKLRAALDARRDPDFVIIARTDALAVEGVDAALDRMQAYAEAGVPFGFIEAPRSVDELSRVARETTIPQLANMLVGGATPCLPADQLEQLGFRMAVDPLATLAASGWSVRQAVEHYLQSGRVDGLADTRLTFDEIKRVLGM